MITPLPANQAVGFDHDGRMKQLDGLLNLGSARADGVVGVGMLCRCKKRLAKPLLVSSIAAARVGPKTRRPRSLKRVHNAQRKRQLRAHDGQIGLLRLGQADHGAEVLEIDRDAAGNLRHAAIARRTNHFSHARAALHRPGQRVFAAPGTKDQDFHLIFPSRLTRPARKTMVGNGGGGSQTGAAQSRVGVPLYWCRMRGTSAARGVCQKSTMVETRIKPYYQQVAEKEAREQQRRAFRRNQVFGLMIVARRSAPGGCCTPIPSGSFPRGGGDGEDRDRDRDQGSETRLTPSCK